MVVAVVEVVGVVLGVVCGELVPVVVAVVVAVVVVIPVVRSLSADLEYDKSKKYTNQSVTETNALNKKRDDSLWQYSHCNSPILCAW